MQSILALAIWTWAVTVVACNDKLKLPVGILYREGDEKVVRAIRTAFSAEKHENFSIKVLEQPYGLSSQINRRICALLGRGIAVLVAFTPLDASSLLATKSNTYHLPLVDVLNSQFGQERPHFGLNMMMDTVKASLDVINFYGWKSAIYISDRVDKPESLLKSLEDGNSYNVILDLVIDSSSVERILGSITILSKTFNKQLNVILDVPQTIIYSILSVLLTEYDERIAHFLITQPVTDDFWNTPLLQNIKSKVTAFSMISGTDHIKFMNYKSNKLLLAYDTGKVISKAISQLYHNNATLVKEISINNTKSLSNCKFYPSIPWIHGLAVARSLKEVKNCQGLTGNIQFDSRGRRRIFTLNILEMSQTETKQIGTWSDKTGLVIHEPIIVSPENVSWIFYISKGAQNKNIVVTSKLMEPYLMERGNSYIGFCKDLIDILSEKINFDYKLRIVQDGEFGTFNSSSRKWSGMIGEIISEKADLAVAPLMVTSERSNVVSFTMPFQYGGITLLAKKEYHAPPFLLFRPFSWEVWIFILIIYIIFGTFLVSIDHFISESQYINHKHYYGRNLQKSLYSRSWAAFIGRLICLIFTIAVLSLYVAKLSAIMLSQENTISRYELLSTKELFEESVITGNPKMLVLKGSSTLKYFQKSRLPLYIQYLNRIKNDPSLIVNSYSEALERILKSTDTMFLLESPIATYISAMNCNFTTSSGTLNTQEYSIALRTESPLRIALNHQMMLLEEDGTLDKLRDKWWIEKSYCNTPNYVPIRNIYKMGEESLTFRDICGLFYLMIFSFVVIAVISICQFFHQKYQKYNREKPRKSTIT